MDNCVAFLSFLTLGNWFKLGAFFFFVGVVVVVVVVVTGGTVVVDTARASDSATPPRLFFFVVVVVVVFFLLFITLVGGDSALFWKDAAKDDEGFVEPTLLPVLDIFCFVRGPLTTVRVKASVAVP